MPASAWPVIKGTWVVGVTLVTIYIAYAQYTYGMLITRPQLLVSIYHASDKYKEAYGEYSHVYKIENVGPITARNVSISINTKHYGRILHRDESDISGDAARNRIIIYGIHLSAQHVGNADIISRPIREDIVVRYEGDPSLVTFWCTPIYTHKSSYIYEVYLDEWLPHPDVPRIEQDDCVY